MNDVTRKQVVPCDIHEVSNCVICNPLPKLRKGTPDSVARMMARFDTVCPSCDDKIFAELDMIVLTDEGWVHEVCT